MIRMTKPLGRYLLGVLRYLQIEAPNQAKDFHSRSIVNWANKWMGEGREERVVACICDPDTGEFPPQIGLDVAVERLENYLKNSRGEISDVIEQLATVLKGSYAYNTMSYELVNVLREVLLTGDEISKITKLLKEKTLSCVTCGHQFISSNYEGCTILRESVTNEYLITCSACSKPRVLACTNRGCSSTVAAPPELQTAWTAAHTACSGKHGKKKNSLALEEETGRASSRSPLEVNPLVDTVGQTVSPPNYWRAARAVRQNSRISFNATQAQVNAMRNLATLANSHPIRPGSDDDGA